MTVRLGEHTAKQIAGAAILDLPRILPRLWSSRGWIGVCNRHDRLERSPDGRGVRVVDDWSSLLYAPRIFPSVGRLLVQRAMQQWPVRFSSSPSSAAAPAGPELSFVVPFRGRDRLPQLLAVVESILGQEGVRVECLVVEQATEAAARGLLPKGVRYRHLPHPFGDQGWRKSWAFNVGALEARAPALVCHDADIVVPAAYGRAIVDLIRDGYEALHLGRFLFKLNEHDGKRVTAFRRLHGCEPSDVVQNWKGGTVAICREAFLAIGGFDQRYVNWGGEDNEFFSRCTALRSYKFGFIPFVHVWHPEQPTKSGKSRDRATLMLEADLVVPPPKRIAALLVRQPLNDAPDHPDVHT